jgi:hypothetical protein
VQQLHAPPLCLNSHELLPSLLAASLEHVEFVGITFVAGRGTEDDTEGVRTTGCDRSEHLVLQVPV